jgi:hypothetical protein
MESEGKGDQKNKSALFSCQRVFNSASSAFSQSEVIMFTPLQITL